MAEIITSKGTGFFIEKVIRGARERIVLISPYLKVQKLYLDELKAAARRGIEVSVLFREEEAKQDQVNALLEVAGIRLFHLPELHAKCYFNEHRFVLTSMNLHDHSERNNKELGIMLELGADEALFKEALERALSILEIAQPMTSSRVKKLHGVGSSAFDVGEGGGAKRIKAKRTMKSDKPPQISSSSAVPTVVRRREIHPAFETALYNKLNDSVSNEMHERVSALPLKIQDPHAQIVKARVHMPRSHEPWTDEENALLAKALEFTNDLEVLMKIFQRSTIALKTQAGKI